MSDKVIIDGVDVSECEFKSLFDNRCCSFADDTENLNCNNKDCYYKQLQRMKVENERLKAFKRECLKPVCFPDIEPEVINKYKQALEEIREIAIYECRHDCSEIYELCTIESCLEKRIQRLINEVLEDENI